MNHTVTYTMATRPFRKLHYALYSVCLSVCLSFLSVPVPNLRTKSSRKPKINAKIAHVTCDSCNELALKFKFSCISVAILKSECHFIVNNNRSPRAS